MYARQVEGRTLTFGVSGKLVRNSLIMFDRETRSLWSHLLGESISGPLRGQHLEVQASTQTSWGEWRRIHPETLVLRAGDPSSAAPDSDPYAGYYRSGDQGVAGRKHADNRLSAKEKVIGLRLGADIKAYAFAALGKARVVNDEVGGVPLVVVFDGGSETGAVYQRNEAERTLTFKAGPSPLSMIDQETGSAWEGLAGRASSGPLAGTTLTQVPVTYSFWFGWADYYPGTQLYR